MHTFSPHSASFSASDASSQRSSRVHPSSLVDPENHSPELMQLVYIKLTRSVIDYIVHCVFDTIEDSRGRTRTRSPYCASFTSFVSNVISRSEVTSATVLTALVYVARARPHLTTTLKKWVLERVFLGALMVAAKYTNDGTLKNVQWAWCTGIFNKKDVGRIEREFLDVLDWNLGITEADLLAHHEGLVADSSPARTHTRSHLKLPPLSARASTHIATKAAQQPKAPHTVHFTLFSPQHASLPSSVVPELDASSPHSQSSGMSVSPHTPAHSPHCSSRYSFTSPYAPASKPDVPIDVDSDSPHLAHPYLESESDPHGLIGAFPLPSAYHAFGIQGQS